MPPEQRLAVTVAERRLDRAISLAKECGGMPSRECSRVSGLVGKLSMLSRADEGASIWSDHQNETCPSMNSPRCPLSNEIQVELPDNVTELDSRRAS